MQCAEDVQAGGPLAGVRVLELGTGVAAPYAGRLLAMLGAVVWKMEPVGGDPARELQVDDDAHIVPGPVYLYLNTGKRNVSRSADRLRAAVSSVDVILDSRVRREVTEAPLLQLLAENRNRTSTYISTTAWGFEGDEAGSPHDELLVQAASGMTTLTGDPGAMPLRLPGYQSQYLAGAYAAAAASSAMLAEPRPRLVDVPWVTAIASAGVGASARYLARHAHATEEYLRTLPRPSGAHPVENFPSGAIRCADGYVVPGSNRHHDWEMQCLVYGMPELVMDERFASKVARAQHYRELWHLIQPWYDAHTRKEILTAAIEVGWALGMVLTAGDVLQDEHLGERAFLAQFESERGRFQAAGRLAHGMEVEWEPAAVQALGADDRRFDEMIGALV